MDKQTAILVGLGIYAVLMVSVALFHMVRVKKPTDFLIAGRGLSWYVLAGTITATSIGTGVVIGGSGVAYGGGWAGSAYPIGLGFGTIVAGLLFARMRRYNFITLSEEVSCYYGGNRIVGELCNLSLFFSQLCWLTVQIKGGAAVFGAVTGLDPIICVTASGLITAMICIPGGLKTVAYTDTLQAIILIIGLGTLTYFALSHSGGWVGLRSSVPARYNSFLGVETLGVAKIASMIIALSLSIIADPGRRLSMFAANTVAGAKWSMVLSGAIVIAFSAIIGIIGMYTFHLNPNLEVKDQALPWLVMNVLPTGLAAFVVVSIVSATISSASSNAIAAGTFYTRHIYPLFTGGRYARRPMLAVRLALAVAFVASTAAAIFTGSIVGFVLTFLPLTMSGLAVIILMGLFWRGATWQGALAAFFTVPAVWLTVNFIPSQKGFWQDPILPATAAGFLAHLVVSLLKPGTKQSFDETARLLQHEREDALGAAEGPTVLDPAPAV